MHPCISVRGCVSRPVFWFVQWSICPPVHLSCIRENYRKWAVNISLFFWTADSTDQLPVGHNGNHPWAIGSYPKCVLFGIKQDFQALYSALESLKLAVKYAILVQASDVLDSCSCIRMVNCSQWPLITYRVVLTRLTRTAVSDSKLAVMNPKASRHGVSLKSGPSILKSDLSVIK